MKISKQILAVILTLLVSVGSACAQLCDIGCVVQSGQVAAPSEAPRHGSPSGHCHQQSPETALQEPSASYPWPAPQKEHSSDCQSHNYAVELSKSGKNAITDAFQKAFSPVAELFHSLDVSFDRLVKGHARGRLEHSPPSPTLHSILRI
jgi:hypothetical protein